MMGTGAPAVPAVTVAAIAASRRGDIGPGGDGMGTVAVAMRAMTPGLGGGRQGKRGGDHKDGQYRREVHWLLHSKRRVIGKVCHESMK
ncbi:hypothetical protein GCM10011289_06940 [Paludibacterium paludis]|uniref:Uncharacterized protein n=1 Tax=Paludibacterium paludis TaxID=1225769 RepID=A0A918U7F0_9NEIS|nr:hypothetical protein GCM10011289_06940 [Paludibacterium paludis]